MRDKRQTENLKDYIAGIIQTSLHNGPYYFDCSPNYKTKIKDVTIIDSLILELAYHASWKPGTTAMVLKYRLIFKLTKTHQNFVVLKESPKGETMLIEVGDPTKTTDLIPKTLKQNEINFPKNWSFNNIASLAPLRDLN